MIGVAVLAVVIAAATTAGIVVEGRLPDGGRPLAARASRLLLWVMIPFAIFFVMARLELTADIGVGIGLAYVELAIVGAIAWVIATRALRLTRPQTGALVVVVILVNTGYLGLPLVAATLGSDALGPAIAFDATVSGPMFMVVAMSIGAALGTNRGESGRDRVVALLRNPPLIAAALGLLAPEALAPDLLLDAAHVVIYLTVPIAFFIVGLTLGGESEEGMLSFPPALTPPVVVALGLRLVAAPALMLALAALVHPVPKAYLLQAGMACGANSVLVAHVHGLDLRITASAVAWSTMIVLVIAIVVAPLL